MSGATLAAWIDAELRRDVPSPVAALARELAAEARGGAAAVLFYGSALRDAALDGVLDFYVLTDGPGDWPGPRWVAVADRVLPPHVGYVEREIDGRPLRAKVAVMTLERFRAAMDTRRLDTTLWARFSQPCVRVHARSVADAARVADAVAAAVVTAARWAALLGPDRDAPESYWRALYLATYDAELRVERRDRGVDLVARDERRYRELLPLAWQAAGIAFDATEAPDSIVAPRIDAATRAAARRRWRTRRRLGRPLNVLRLLKAALTFDRAIDYVAWKIERHSGHRIEPTAFQRKHPLLAAPSLYRRLRALGVLR